MQSTMSECDLAGLALQARYETTTELRDSHVIGRGEYASSHVRQTADGVIHAMLWVDEASTGRRWAVCLVDVEPDRSLEQFITAAEELGRRILSGVEPC